MCGECRDSGRPPWSGAGRERTAAKPLPVYLDELTCCRGAARRLKAGVVRPAARECPAGTPLLTGCSEGRRREQSRERRWGAARRPVTKLAVIFLHAGEELRPLLLLLHEEAGAKGVASLGREGAAGVMSAHAGLAAGAEVMM